MTSYLSRADLSVAAPIVEFAESALADSGRDADAFWAGASALIHDLVPRNAALLRRRDELQQRIDDFHRAHPGVPDKDAYRALLTEIGYLVPEPEHVAVTTENVDAELATMAGPQLVVPLLNARFAINAANARWGSLYDALYGTDAISQEGELAPGTEFNYTRAAEVVAWGREFLDEIAPLSEGTHRDATAYRVDAEGLVVDTADGERRLRDASGFVGYAGEADAPTAVLLVHNGLHAEIVIDRSGRIGTTDAAGVQDIILESAVTAILDLEDSVAAVDGDDKALGYRNWRGFMDGTLSETVTKGGRTFTRTLAADRTYNRTDGSEVTLPGRALLFVRNVGHLMRTDAVLDRDGEPIFEGILDAIMTALGTLPELEGPNAGRNSRTGSMYIVKPKMHGPEEVAFAAELFGRVEQLLGLPARTMKVGIMDEERRGEPRCCDRRGIRSGRVHQHGIPRPHRRRDPHLAARGSLPAQGRDQAAAVHEGVRRPQRRDRGRLRPRRARPDRQGHVGRARPHARHAAEEDRASPVRSIHCLGALADRRDPARPALPPGRSVRGARDARAAGRQRARRPARAPARG